MVIPEDTKNILEYLEEHQIVAFEVSKCFKFIQVMEQCDAWYREELTKEQFGRMIAELTKLHSKMED